MKDKFETCCDKFKIKIDKYHKGKKYYKEYKYLFSILCDFLEGYDLDDNLKNKLLKYVIRGDWREARRYFDVFTESLTWSESEKGYNFFYFLNLKWLEGLCKIQPMVPSLFNKKLALSHLSKCIDYAETPYYYKDKERYNMPHRDFLKRRDRYLTSLRNLARKYHLSYDVIRMTW